MVRSAKGTARVLIDDEPPPRDPMTVDYRERCVYDCGPYAVIRYGTNAVQFNSIGMLENEAVDVDTDFNHSAGRGLLPGRRTAPPEIRHFFTPGIGRKEEVLLRQKLRRL